MYNLIKRTEVEYRVIFRKSYIVSAIITFTLLMILCSVILEYNIQNYLLAIVFMIYTISGYIVRGFNKRGLYHINEITNTAKFTKWQDIKAINIAYNEEDFIDVTFLTGIKSINHRYKEEVEKVLIKVKSDLNI